MRETKENEIADIFFLFFFSVVAITSNGQIATFDISNYTYPDVDRRTFFISPALNFSDQYQENNSRSSFDFDCNIQGSYIKNSRKFQQSKIFRTNVSYASNEGDNQASEKYFDIEMFGYMSNRYFINPKRFFELEFTGEAIYERQNIESFAINDYLSTRTLISPKFGWGRIENVTDAWHAIRILEELKKSGHLTRDLDSLEINLLANEISKLKNYRSRDLRLERIYEFKELAKFLVLNKICDESDYGFYAILKDAYDFEGFQNRSSGSTFTIGLFNNYRTYNTNIHDSGYQILHDYGIAFEYEKFNPLSKDWQLSESYTVGIQRNNNKFSDFGGFNRQWQGSLSGNVRVGYFMNARTYFSLGPRVTYSKYFDPDIRSIRFLLYGYGYYYFSPRLRFDISGSFNFSQFGIEFQNPTNRNSIFIRAGFDYFLF